MSIWDTARSGRDKHKGSRGEIQGRGGEAPETDMQHLDPDRASAHHPHGHRGTAGDPATVIRGSRHPDDTTGA